MTRRDATEPKGQLRFLYLHPVGLPGPEANLIQTAETCRALAERGHEVFLIVPGLKAASAEAGLRQLGVAASPNLFVVAEPAIRLKNPGRVASVFVRAMLLWYLRNLVARGRTVLWFRTLRDSRLARFILTAGRWLRVPVVYEAHKIYTEKRRDQGFGEDTLARVGRLEARVFREADGVVASHPLLEEELRSGFRANGPLMTAENGVPLLPIANGAPRFDLVYAGSLFAWKGVDICLETIARVEGATLAIVGGNPAERLDELKELARRLGIGARVTFFGQLPRGATIERLGEARVALVPLDPEFSEGERYTCPLKMLEAMMRGVPVVAADTPAIRSLVTDGVTALLAPRGDVAALARSVEALIRDPALARRLAAAARERALDYTFAERARKLEAFAASLL